MSQGETPNETPSSHDRRTFLKTAALTGGVLAAAGIPFPSVVKAASSPPEPHQVPLPANLPAPGKANHWFLPATDKTVHWGYFSKNLKPAIEIESGDFVTLECLTHQAGDDYERMIKGDPGAESVYYWNKQQKNVNRRGAGAMDAPVGAGGGEGVHICTGPIYVRGAQPGDILEVRILDMYPRPCGNSEYKNRTFGTNLAANWGYRRRSRQIMAF